MNDVISKLEAEDDEFKPLTAAEAKEWRKRHPSPSLWRVVRFQIFAGSVLAVLAGVVTQSVASGLSAGYGALCVVLPAVVFARGVSRTRNSAVSALAGFAVWELAKIALTLSMLWTAPRWLGSVHWLPLVVALVVTMKMYWVALLVRPSVQKTID